jgi:threonine dehydrogenase-like Zn-dependent dehydrogenase
METMQAAVVYGDGTLEVRAVPLPEIGPYQALVRLSWGATCAGTDQRVIEGGHPNPIAYPAILGHESVGRAVRLGEKVRSFREGALLARVGTPPLPQVGLGVCWGGFAQYGVATDWRAMEADGLLREQWDRARVQQVIPDDVDEQSTPMFITWRETLSYTDRVGVKQGDQVLVAGSGANALAFIAHCAYAGARVVSLGSAKRSQDALDLGAAAALDYASAQLERDLAGAFPDGLDLILDAVGHPANTNAALPLLRGGGTVAVYGWGNRTGYGVNPFLAKDSFRVYCGGYDEAETHEEVLRRVREGALDAQRWYSRSEPIPLRDLASAYQRLQRREAYKFLIDLT